MSIVHYLLHGKLTDPGAAKIGTEHSKFRGSAWVTFPTRPVTSLPDVWSLNAIETLCSASPGSKSTSYSTLLPTATSVVPVVAKTTIEVTAGTAESSIGTQIKMKIIVEECDALTCTSRRKRKRASPKVFILEASSALMPDLPFNSGLRHSTRLRCRNDAKENTASKLHI